MATKASTNDMDAALDSYCPEGPYFPLGEYAHVKACAAARPKVNINNGQVTQAYGISLARDWSIEATLIPSTFYPPASSL